jgi:hypothetical protein
VRTLPLLFVAACGAGGQTPPIDAPPDGPPPISIDEAADCGGDALVPRQGDAQLIASRLVVSDLASGFDLDADGQPDNKLSALASLAASSIQDGLVAGTYVVPIEIFDRGGDPDACVKLALYRGICSGTCNFTDATRDTVTLDATSFDGSGAPISRMRSMATDAGGELSAEPGILVITVPGGSSGLDFNFPIGVQQVTGTLAGPGLAGLVRFRVGGTMQAFRLDSVPAPQSPDLGTMPGDTLLDISFANLIGPLLALPKSAVLSTCRTGDIDIDRDGLESFCDSNPDDEIKRVDTCIDGDGTVVRDGDNGVARCTDAMIGPTRRFPDGISAAIELDAIAVTIAP